MLLRERGRSRIGGKKRLGRWHIRSWQTSSLMKWWTNMEGHESSTKTDFFLLHQRLVFPCIWAAVMHGTGVPAPPEARLPLQEVKERGCHKRKMVRQSPNDLPVKLPWGGNGKLQLLPWTSTRASTEDRWRPHVMWCGCRPLKEQVCKAEGMTSMPIDTGG